MTKRLCEADLVVTSFFHIEELERMMPGESSPLTGMNLRPEMSTIVKIARIAPDTQVGMVAALAREKPVAEFPFALDKGSVDNIRIALFEMKRKKEMGEPHIGELD